MTWDRGVSKAVGTHGFVQLVDWMGDDHRILQAARVSFGAEEKAKDPVATRRIIRFMMNEQHTSPFEQVELAFRIQCPMDVWRQWIRHRTANVNEYSTRYTEALDLMSRTGSDEWRLQAKGTQGSTGMIDRRTVGTLLSERELDLQEYSRAIYQERIEAGVAYEQARKDLPLSTYTRAYWKIDLHNLLHFLRLRMDSHAQAEIQEFANVIGTVVADLFPITWEAFVDYELEGMHLTRMELAALPDIFSLGDTEDSGTIMDRFRKETSKREHDVFVQKLFKMGVFIHIS